MDQMVVRGGGKLMSGGNMREESSRCGGHDLVWSGRNVGWGEGLRS